MAENKNLRPEYISTGKPLATGAIFFGPANAEGTATLPADATTALPTGYKCVGHIAQNSVSTSNNLNTTSHLVWGGTEVLNTVDSFSKNFNFSCVETNETVMASVWGSANVKGDRETGMTVDYGPEGFDEVHVWVIMVVHQNGAVERIVIPKGKISGLDNTNYQDSDLVSYPLTIAALSGGFADKPTVTARSYISKPDALNDMISQAATLSSEPVTPVSTKKAE